MFCSIDTCQNKVSADQYHMTISRAQAYSSPRSFVFLKLTTDQVLIFYWIAGSIQVNTRLHFSCGSTRLHGPYCINYSSYTVHCFRVQVENGLENVFFLHFSLVSIQFDIS